MERQQSVIKLGDKHEREIPDSCYLFMSTTMHTSCDNNKYLVNYTDL